MWSLNMTYSIGKLIKWIARNQLHSFLRSSSVVFSDSDFTSLASRFRESEIHVIGVGKAMTPTSFKNVCDDFVAIENLNADVELEGVQSSSNQDAECELWRLMHHAWQNYRDESGWAKLGEIGKYLKRLKPDFDPRNYGLKKLSDFFISINTL